MGRVKRRAQLTGAVLTLALLAPAAAQANPDPCRTLRSDVVEQAIDYALERSSRGELAEAPDLRIRIELRECEPQSPRRADWQFRLSVCDKAAELVHEDGSVTVTRNRATWRPLG